MVSAKKVGQTGHKVPMRVRLYSGYLFVNNCSNVVSVASIDL